MDDETTARFELLKVELGHIESGIRGFDNILFQVKGWCVTVAVAVSGLALTVGKPAVLVVALGAIGGFWLVDGLYKSLQRILIDHSAEVAELLNQGTVAEVLASGKLRVPAVATAFRSLPQTATGIPTSRWMGFWQELRRPLTFSLYLMLAVLVVLLGTAMVLF